MDPLAFREAFYLLKDRSLLTFMITVGVISALLQFYFGLAGTFLEQGAKISGTWVPAALAFAQIFEIFAMYSLLPFFMRRLGLKMTIVLGSITWPIQYFLFALIPIVALQWMQPIVLVALNFHGLGYPLFMIGSQIYMDRVSPKDIRASSQSLLELVSLGIGGILGTLLTAQMMAFFTHGSGGEAHTRWEIVFGIPAFVALIFVALLYKNSRSPETIPKSCDK